MRRFITPGCALSLCALVGCSEAAVAPGADAGSSGGPCVADDECSGGYCVDVVSSASASSKQCKSPCEAYCEEAEWTCTGASSLFTDHFGCLASCATYPAYGRGGDLEGDTVQCRYTHLLAARGDASHCAHGGASGGGACGSECDVYCRMVQSFCQGANALYTDVVACLTACAAFATDGHPGDLTGNTVQCRLSHAGAAETEPGTHCIHAGAASTAGACQ